MDQLAAIRKAQQEKFAAEKAARDAAGGSPPTGEAPAPGAGGFGIGGAGPGFSSSSSSSSANNNGWIMEQPPVAKANS